VLIQQPYVKPINRRTEAKNITSLIEEIRQKFKKLNSVLTFPIESPPATDNITPTTLQISVLILTMCGILIPFKKHLICGMPLPAATGCTIQHHANYFGSMNINK